MPYIRSMYVGSVPQIRSAYTASETEASGTSSGVGSASAIGVAHALAAAFSSGLASAIASARSTSSSVATSAGIGSVNATSSGIAPAVATSAGFASVTADSDFDQFLNVLLYLSGGASNDDQRLSIGGAKSSVLAPNEIFGPVIPSQFELGVTLYRCVYPEVDSPVDIRARIHSDTPGSDTVIELGWGTAAIDGTESAIANEFTAPAGVTFGSPESLDLAPSGGDLADGQHKPLWLKYIASPLTVPRESEMFVIEVAGPIDNEDEMANASSSGVANVVGVGASLRAAIGSSNGIGILVGVGSSSSLGTATGTSSGVGVATGAGAKISAATGTVNGVGTANAAGDEEIALTFVVPATIQIVQGQDYDMSGHVDGGVPPYDEFALEAGSWPDGVTMNDAGLISVSGSAAVGTTTGYQVGADDSAGTAGAGLSAGLGVAIAVGRSEARTSAVSSGSSTVVAVTAGSAVGASAGLGAAAAVGRSEVRASAVSSGSSTVVGATEVPPGDLNVDLQLLSPSGGTDLPFTFGHIFAEGEVSPGQYVDTGLTDWQCRPMTYWPDDNSVRTAIIAGRANCTPNVPTVFTLTTSNTNRTGTALTQTYLSSVLPVTTISATGANLITLNNLINTSAMHHEICSGPIMSNWHYRAPLSNSNHLVAWFDVRVYIGGAVEVFPWIENAYLMMPNPGSDSRNFIFSMGGVEKYNATIDMKHHTRIALLDNTATSFKHWSYWSIADPQIEPIHDTVYMSATKMVPKYGWAPDETALIGINNSGTYISYTQTYFPNWIGNTKAAMGGAGFGIHIGVLPNWQALYISSGGDRRPYRSVLANALAAGAWSVHYRDEVTNDPPEFADWPELSWAWDSNTPHPSSSEEELLPVNTDINDKPAAPDRSHQPSFAYLAYLLTGRWFFLEEEMFWMTWSQIHESDPIAREFGKNLLLDNTTRGRGWRMRTLAHLLVITPETHPCFDDFKYMWEQNMIAYHDLFVTGTKDNGIWANSMGWLGTYSGRGGGDSGYYMDPDTSYGFWWDSNWMQMIITMALTTGSNLKVPQSAQSKAAHIIIRDTSFKVIINLTGDGSPGTWNYRRYPVSAVPIGTDQFGNPPDVWESSYGNMYANYEAYGWADLGDRELGIVAMNPLPTGNTIRNGNNPVSASNWRTNSGTCFGYATLAWAKELGIPGANESWARVTGSDSWALVAGPTGAFSTIPMWGFWPRNV